MEQSLRSRVNMTGPTLSPAVESGLQRIRRKLDNEDNKPITLAQAMRPNPGEGANRLRAFLGQGLGLRGGDEIEALARSLYTGEEYDTALQSVSENYENYKTNNPMEAESLELAGSFAPAVLLSLFTRNPAPVQQLATRNPTAYGKLMNVISKANPARLLPAGQTLGSNMARQGLLGGAFGATEGYLGSNQDEREAGSFGGGLTGGIFGTLFPVAGRFAGRTFDAVKNLPPLKALGDYLTGSPTRQTFEQQEAVGDILDVVERANTSPSQLAENLESLSVGPNRPKLLDLDPSLTEKARKLTKENPVEAQSMSLSLRERQNRNAQDLIQLTQRNISDVDRQKIKEQYETRMTLETGPDYERAFDWKNPNGSAANAQGLIDDTFILEKLKTPEFKTAFELAKTTNDLKLRQNIPGTRPLKDVLSGELPDVYTLNAIKKSLDDMIGGFTSKGARQDVTGETKRTLRFVKNQMLDRLDEITKINGVSPYATARKKFGSAAEVLDAMKEGEKFLAKPSQEIKTYFDGLSDEAKKSYIASTSQAIQRIARRDPSKREDFGGAIATKTEGSVPNYTEAIVNNPEIVEKLRIIFPNNNDRESIDLYLKTLAVNAKLMDNAKKATPSALGKDISESNEVVRQVGRVASEFLTGGANYLSPSNLAYMVTGLLQGKKVKKGVIEETVKLLDSEDPQDLAVFVEVLKKTQEKNAIDRTGKRVLSDITSITVAPKITDDSDTDNLPETPIEYAEGGSVKELENIVNELEDMGIK